MDKRIGAVQFEASTREDAIAKAQANLGVSIENLGYEIVKESTGLLSFLTGGKKVIISAWRRNETQEARGGRSHRGERRDRPERRERREREPQQPRSTEPAAPARELTSEEMAALTGELCEFYKGICEQLGGDSVTVSSKVDDGRLILDATSEFLAAQISKNSKLSEALEHVLRKKPRHLKQELPFRIFADANGVRQARETELIETAKELSAKVHEDQKPVVLNYRNSYDRKVIHMALEKDERVYTKSVGSGPNRKLMILPSNGEVAADFDESASL